MSQSTEENRLCLDPITEELRAWKKIIEVKANTPSEIAGLINQWLWSQLPDNARRTLRAVTLMSTTDPAVLAARLKLDIPTVEKELSYLRRENLLDDVFGEVNTEEILHRVEVRKRLMYILETGYLPPDTPDIPERPRPSAAAIGRPLRPGIYSLVDLLGHTADTQTELLPIELDETDIAPVIITRTSDEADKAAALGFASRWWQSGVEELIGRRPVAMTFHNETAVSALLPKVFSLKVINGLPDKPAKLQAAIDAAQERRVRLIVVQADAFLEENIPPREVLLETADKKSPILFAQSINQIFAWRGTGKTNIAFGVAHALATGGQFLRWRAPRPVKVLYVEGELPAYQMQERISQIVGKTDGNLRIITLDKQPQHEIPSLASPLGQTLLEEALGDAQVLVLDSISTLFNIATNDEENWLSIQNWFKRMRSKGLCIIFLHHAGKSGLQRGSSKSEDLLDISIKLSRPGDYHVTDGLRCNVEFDKTRGVALLDGEPIEVQMQIEDGHALWTCASTEQADFGRASSLYEANASVRDVAREMEVSTGKAAKWRRRWQEERGELVLGS